MNKNRFRNIEWKILIYIIILISIGLLAMYSATTSTEFTEFKKQIIWISISIPILMTMIFIDYKLLAKFSIFFYVITIALLALVLLTESVNGARSWFNIGSFSLQPGEIGKIATILFLANIISKMRI